MVAMLAERPLGASRLAGSALGSNLREGSMTAATSAAPVRDEQLSINGLRIHAQIRGEGEPLLLFSGVWGEAGLWEQLLPHLAGFRTIAFDPPGIGRSQMPDRKSTRLNSSHL